MQKNINTKKESNYLLNSPGSSSSPENVDSVVEAPYTQKLLTLASIALEPILSKKKKEEIKAMINYTQQPNSTGKRILNR